MVLTFAWRNFVLFYSKLSFFLLQAGDKVHSLLEKCISIAKKFESDQESTKLERPGDEDVTPPGSPEVPEFIFDGKNPLEIDVVI